jgi:hypothetical protein
MAASAAANLLALTTRVKATAHANSKIMFHGAAGYTEGGAEAHADTAELLEKINGEIKTVLVKHGMKQDEVDSWFAEGRQGWLDATQAKAVGLIDEIIPDRASQLKFAASDLTMFAESGIAIAACAVADEPEQAAPPAPVTVIIPDLTQAKPEEKPDNTALVAAEIAVVRAEIEATHKAEIEALNAKHAEAITAKDALISKMQSTADKAKAEADGYKTKLGELNARIDKLLSGSITFQTTPEVATWEDALAACDNDYAEARRKHPAQYAAFMERRNRK